MVDVDVDVDVDVVAVEVAVCWQVISVYVAILLCPRHRCLDRLRTFFWDRKQPELRCTCST